MPQTGTPMVPEFLTIAPPASTTQSLWWVLAILPGQSRTPGAPLGEKMGSSASKRAILVESASGLPSPFDQSPYEIS